MQATQGFCSKAVSGGAYRNGLHLAVGGLPCPALPPDVCRLLPCPLPRNPLSGGASHAMPWSYYNQPPEKHCHRPMCAWPPFSCVMQYSAGLCLHVIQPRTRDFISNNTWQWRWHGCNHVVCQLSPQGQDAREMGRWEVHAGRQRVCTVSRKWEGV